MQLRQQQRARSHGRGTVTRRTSTSTDRTRLVFMCAWYVSRERGSRVRSAPPCLWPGRLCVWIGSQVCICEIVRAHRVSHASGGNQKMRSTGSNVGNARRRPSRGGPRVAPRPVIGAHSDLVAHPPASWVCVTVSHMRLGVSLCVSNVSRMCLKSVSHVHVHVHVQVHVHIHGNAEDRNPTQKNALASAFPNRHPNLSTLGPRTRALSNKLDLVTVLGSQPRASGWRPG